MTGNVRVFCTVTDLRVPVQVFVDICILEEVVRLIDLPNASYGHCQLQIWLSYSKELYITFNVFLGNSGK